MRLIIEARLAAGDSDTVNDGDGVLAVVERRDCGLDQLGLTLAEGRSLLAKVQAELIRNRCSGGSRARPIAGSVVLPYATRIVARRCDALCTAK